MLVFKHKVADYLYTVENALFCNPLQSESNNCALRHGGLESYLLCVAAEHWMHLFDAVNNTRRYHVAESTKKGHQYNNIRIIIITPAHSSPHSTTRMTMVQGKIWLNERPSNIIYILLTFINVTLRLIFALTSAVEDLNRQENCGPLS